MKKPKKNKKQKASKDGNGKAKSGLIGKLILPLALAVTSFCTVYFLPRTEAAPNMEAAQQSSQQKEGQAHGLDGDHPKQIDTSFITLEPFTVSLKGRTRILRLSITIEAPSPAIDYIDPNDPKLRDAFMGYLSALGIEQVEDAAFLVQVRAQLSRRAQFVLGADSVHNILITDFMVR